jgi:predicted PurR-regulated permease PerM
VLLGFTTFLVGVIQLPSALVLLPMAAWLGWHGDTWQAVFLTVWTLAVVGTLDNVVRPYLISQGADLPFLLILAGVIGGLLAWGFIGIFLGATLLAVSYRLFATGSRTTRPAPARPRLVVAGTSTTEETR